MLVGKNMGTLVFTLNYFHCFEGNIGNMAVTRKRPHRQRANICHFVSYIRHLQDTKTMITYRFVFDIIKCHVLFKITCTYLLALFI